MKAVEFPEVNVRVAEHQDEFITLPVFHDPKEGSIVFGFELDKDELEEVAKTGKIFFKQYTGNGAMQPVGMSTRKAVLIPNSKEEESIK